MLMLVMLMQMMLMLVMLMLVMLMQMILMMVKEMMYLQVLDSPSYSPCVSRLAEKCKYAVCQIVR